MNHRSGVGSGAKRGPTGERRGGVVVMVAFAMTMLLCMMAFVVELSHLMSVTSELQVVADAAALAAVDGLVRARNATYADTGDATAALNMVQGSPATVTYSYGNWNNTTSTYSTPAASFATADAVQSTATSTGAHFFFGLLGASGTFTLSRHGTAWGGGSVRSSTCTKPWVVDYRALLNTIGHPITDTGYVLTEADIALLSANGPANPVAIKLGSGATGDITQGGRTFPGAFGAVQFPPLNQGPVPGASAYQANIESNCTNAPIGVGDQLLSEQGNMAGPTEKGMETLCGVSVNGNQSWTCPTPVPVDIAIYASTANSNGKPVYIVKYLGSFMLTGYSKSGGVLGYFSLFTQPGEGFSPFPGPIRKLILVQ
ncbi:MAG: pilus assembly protein TadG-related protein [Gemmatimonadaceae bacterium]